jgi:ribosomal-protein-alanine N-acetyltransferase
MKICPLSPDDCNEIYAINASSQIFPWSKKQIEDEINLTHWASFVAKSEDGAKVLGYVFIRGQEGEFELISLAVEANSQRQGVGKKLMAAVEDALKKSHNPGGGIRIFLEVSVKNQKALRFYSALGYVERGRRAQYYPDSTDALVMVKSL